MSKSVGAGLTTKDLFERARSELGELERLVVGRRNKDRACTRLTDFFLLIDAIARRVQEVEFSSAVVCREEDEQGAATEASSSMGIGELFEIPATDAEMSEAERQAVDVRELRLFYFRLMTDFQVKGCRTLEDLVRKVLAWTRRFRPEALEDFGVSLTDVGRAFGKSKQNMRAGEKRLVERLLEANGTKGILGAGGQKSTSHREKCRLAQMGNTHRRDGERRKREGRPFSD